MGKPVQHPAVGIDLGTTFSAVAFLDESGRPETIRNAEGGLTTPSAVFFDRTHPIVGVEAVEAGMQEPERLAMFAKRDMGEAWYEKKIRGETLPPEVLQALVLKKIKADTELKLGPIQKAVVTVPAFFNEPCRKATQDAGQMAGLEVLDIINEPTAAAIIYGIQRGFLSSTGESKQRERVLVYDLGGGTFDVTLMEIDGRSYTTIGTAGDVYLGGIDWDRRIVDFIADAFSAEHDIDPRKDPSGEQELLRKANQAKHALTQRDSFQLAFTHDGHRLRIELSQKDFARITEDLVERTLMTTRLVLDDAGFKFSDLTRLILVGGSTRMPMIRHELEQLSGLELDRSLSPDEAVCHGAAIYAGILLKHPGKAFAGVSVTNVNSHDLGVLAIDPATGNPRRQIMIARNSALPASRQIRFRTHTDDQANVKIQVVEGGDAAGTNATTIGKCMVDPLPPNTPKGTDVNVRFDYAQDGRLTVSGALPSLACKAETLFDRAAGLSEFAIDKWMQRMEAGLGDPDPAEIAKESVESVDPKTIDPKSIDPKSIDLKTIDLKTIDPKSIDPKTIDPKTIDLKTIDPKTIDRKTTDRKTTDRKTTDRKTIDPKTIDRKTTDRKRIDPKTIDPKTIDPKTIDRKSIDPKSIGPKSIGPKSSPAEGDSSDESPVDPALAQFLGKQSDTPTTARDAKIEDITASGAPPIISTGHSTKSAERPPARKKLKRVERKVETEDKPSESKSD